MFGIPSQTGNQPKEMVTIDMINGESAVYSYWVAPGVTTFLVDFTNKKFYIKAVDSRGIQQQIRTFAFEELVQTSPETNQNGSANPNYVTVDQFNELKTMLLSLTTPQTPSPNPQGFEKKRKGGTNQ